MLTRYDFHWSQGNAPAGSEGTPPLLGSHGEYDIELKPLPGPEGMVLATALCGIGNVLGARTTTSAESAVDFAVERINCDLQRRGLTEGNFVQGADRVLQRIEEYVGIAACPDEASEAVAANPLFPVDRHMVCWSRETRRHDGAQVRRVVGDYHGYRILLTPMSGDRISAAAMRGDHALGLKFTPDPGIAVASALNRINEDAGAMRREPDDRSREVLEELRLCVGLGSRQSSDRHFLSVSNGGEPIVVSDPDFFAKDVADKVADYSQGGFQSPLMALAGVRRRCTEMAGNLHRIHQVTGDYLSAKTQQSRKSQQTIAGWVLGDCYRLAAENEALCILLSNCDLDNLFDRQTLNACLSAAQVEAQAALRYWSDAAALWVRESTPRTGLAVGN